LISLFVVDHLSRVGKGDGVGHVDLVVSEPARHEGTSVASAGGRRRVSRTEVERVKQEENVRSGHEGSK
jgi:hypothetical protein